MERACQMNECKGLQIWKSKQLDFLSTWMTVRNGLLLQDLYVLLDVITNTQTMYHCARTACCRGRGDESLLLDVGVVRLQVLGFTLLPRLLSAVKEHLVAAGAWIENYEKNSSALEI
ncbi:hypothetical protein L798_01993 [Zootermopsis nevadensis]|uniref:Uncharacterized protein n=1 Tax=Zootermopsis nevadensis TaxID=136037 RepID=A0A067REZ2_ZOONE|nr:hypothetical protein L798_01993 [Zootermopsis nevadensis]